HFHVTGVQTCALPISAVRRSCGEPSAVFIAVSRPAIFLHWITRPRLMKCVRRHADAARQMAYSAQVGTRTSAAQPALLGMSASLQREPGVAVVTPVRSE